MIKKKILLGICGSIAACKIPELVNKLNSSSYEVKIILTQAASHFIAKVNFQTEVYEHLFNPDDNTLMEHIDLARWADLILIAPASAHILAKLAHGFADDLLSTICLASAAPVAIVPAMNQQMWQHAAVQANVELLQNRGIQFFGPAIGLQACGDYGPGRMIEPIDIIAEVNAFFQEPYLTGKKILITAGPTRETIDPVRYLTNRSSGKMGYALARAAQRAGAEVTLITGPTAIPVPSCKTVIQVTSAKEMLDAVEKNIDRQDIFIAAAAVADYHISHSANEKIKRSTENLTLTLEPTVDILATICAKQLSLITVGFAAETQHVEQYAKNKLQKKSAHFIIANDVSRADIGFDSDQNAVNIISTNETVHLEKASKQIIAEKILRVIVEA